MFGFDCINLENDFNFKYVTIYDLCKDTIKGTWKKNGNVISLNVVSHGFLYEKLKYSINFFESAFEERKLTMTYENSPFDYVSVFFDDNRENYLLTDTLGKVNLPDTIKKITIVPLGFHSFEIPVNNIRTESDIHVNVKSMRPAWCTFFPKESKWLLDRKGLHHIQEEDFLINSFYKK